MKTDARLVIIPNPCCSVALGYRVEVEAKSLSTSHHSGVLASSHEKQSVMKLRPGAILYTVRGKKKKGRLFSLCLGELQSHNGHSYPCCSSIHFDNKCCTKGTGSFMVTPSKAAMTQAKHMSKIHDILCCCFSTPCS